MGPHIRLWGAWYAEQNSVERIHTCERNGRRPAADERRVWGEWCRTVDNKVEGERRQVLRNWGKC